MQSSCYIETYANGRYTKKGKFCNANRQIFWCQIHPIIYLKHIVMRPMIAILVYSSGSSHFTVSLWTPRHPAGYVGHRGSHLTHASLLSTVRWQGAVSVTVIPLPLIPYNTCSLLGICAGVCRRRFSCMLTVCTI